MSWLWPTVLVLRGAFVVVATAVAFREAATFKRDGGRSPWDWSPTVWALIAAFLTFFGGVVGLVVAALALSGAKRSTEYNAPRPGAFELTPKRLRWAGVTFAALTVIATGLVLNGQRPEPVPMAGKESAGSERPPIVDKQVTTPASEQIALRDDMARVADGIAQAENAHATRTHGFVTVPHATSKVTVGEAVVDLPSGVDVRIATSSDGSRLCVVLHSAPVGAVIEQSVVWLRGNEQPPTVTDCPKGYGRQRVQTAKQALAGFRLCRPLGAGVVSTTVTTVGAVRKWVLVGAPQLADQVFPTGSAKSPAAWCWQADPSIHGYKATVIDGTEHWYRVAGTDTQAIPSGPPSFE